MGRPRKYNTEEERIAARKAYNAAYSAAHKDEIAAKQAAYRAAHKDEIAARNKAYRVAHKEEISTKRAEYLAAYYQEHREKVLAQQAKRYQENRDEIRAQRAERYKQNKDKYLAKEAEWRKNNPEYMTKYRLTPKGRAKTLLHGYRQADKNQNRGECTITEDWIVHNVFSGQCCHYCGESDWHKLGCDRIDNSKPHTPENCVCSCWECNNKRKTTDYDKFMRLIGKVK